MRINQKQKYVIMGGLLLIVVMFLFPPWYGSWIETYGDVLQGELRSTDTYRYGFFTKPPYSNNTNIPYRLKLDVRKLSIQVLVVVALTGVGVIAFNKETEPDS